MMPLPAAPPVAMLLPLLRAMPDAQRRDAITRMATDAAAACKNDDDRALLHTTALDLLTALDEALA